MKRSLLVDEKGAPLSIVICGANEHDITQLEALLEAKIIEAPENQAENLCLDTGFTGAEKRLGKRKRQYAIHIRSRGEERREIAQHPDFKLRRWIVEARTQLV